MKTNKQVAKYWHDPDIRLHRGVQVWGSGRICWDFFVDKYCLRFIQ